MDEQHKQQGEFYKNLDKSMDISSIITANINTYLKPKYPIYRVKYFKAEIKFEDEGENKLESDCYERICELKEDDDTYNNYFEEDKNIIFERLLWWYEKSNKSFKVIDNEYENVIIIGLEKLA